MRARQLLEAVHLAYNLLELSTLPRGSRFKELHGPLRGTYQLRVGGPYRIRFRWSDGHAVEIQASHFHDED
jgi:plasmid maintenance system killer protein